MRRILVLPAMLVIVSAAHAHAHDDICNSTAGLSCAQMQIAICPRSDFGPIRNGCGGTGCNKDAGESGLDTCCDYNGDDRCDLSDLAHFGAHYQHSCR